MMTYPKRLIEVDLPIKRISAHSRREKSIRHGHISTLHIWWARRPLAACRAVICATLWPDPVDPLCPESFQKAARAAMLEWTSHERQILLSLESRPRFEAARKKPAHFDDPMELRGALLDFIADFSNWDNSTVKEYLATSRALTQAAHEALGGVAGTRPLVVDPFAGGGSIPLEALRVGADAFASDLNPVPVLLNKVVLEYIPKYGQRLADEVRKWGAWVKQEAEKELAEFYPKDADGATPIAYIWARTIISEAPASGMQPVEIPLLSSMWLAKKNGRHQALRWKRNKAGQIVTETNEKKFRSGQQVCIAQPQLEIFSPSGLGDIETGTSKAGSATCPISGYTTSVESVRRQLNLREGGAADSRLICVVTTKPNTPGRFYRLPTENDLLALSVATKEFEKQSRFQPKSEPYLPDGEINHLRGFFNIVLYGMKNWGNIFAPRQALALVTLTRLVSGLRTKLASELDGNLAAAIQTCLAIAVDRQADSLSSLTRWQSSRETNSNTFGRQALPMVWDYVEPVPISQSAGSISNALDWILAVINANSCISGNGHAEKASATAHPLPDDSADAFITDPPYYAAIPYADLSDFFYSWIRKSLKEVHPDLLSEKLSPKVDECVSLSHRAAMYRHKDGPWFEKTMARACAEGRRIAKPSGIGVLVFANKETSGWEAMLSALVGSGWVITASWPIDTEMGSRLRAKQSAALASSVHLVCRPREKLDGSIRTDDIGDWRDVLAELPGRIHEWMPRLVEEGVVGADAIFACLGPALEIFSRYSRVEKASGENVALKEYLEYVWAAVAKEALAQVFKDADTAAFEPDARLTAMWLWTLNAGAGSDAEGTDEDEDSDDDDDAKGKTSKAKKGGFVLEYDAARKISQGLGANLDNLKHVVEVSGETARLLPVAERTQYLFGKDQAQAPSGGRKKKQETQMDFFGELTKVSADETAWGEKTVKRIGETTLDRIHQSMILFATGRGEALKRFLIDDGAGNDQRFWRLAQALSALYPVATNEKRWVDGVLARKKGLGL
jgi:putative DNA methylase